MSNIQEWISGLRLPSLAVPKNLSLFIVPTVALAIGIGALIILWKKKK